MTPEVICHPENKGKGAAMKTGFAAAGGADIIVTMDTDGQHDPAEIPKLIAPIQAGEADMVNGSRYISDNVKNKNPYYFMVPCKEIDNT
jgi:glycosyltransferase involved in cell wall biosynthesis